MATHSLFHEFLNSVKTRQKICFTDFVYVFIGLFTITPVFVLYFIITLPFIVYRGFVAFILSKLYRKHHRYRNMISPGFSTAYAIDYLSTLHAGQPSRNTILTTQVLEGHVPLDIFKEKLESAWVKSKNNNNCWKFPELRSYVDNWMGYCYWREESNFDFNTHVHYHKIEESQDVEKFTFNLSENIMNTPFMSKRSPWDVHVIHGWKHDKTSSENNNTLVTNTSIEITVTLVRCHHVLGDGNSLVYLILQDLFGICLKDLEKQADKNVPQTAFSVFQQLRTFTSTTIKLLWDFGCIASFVIWRAKTNTRLHVSETHNLRFVHYKSSSSISMDTVKNVAKKFGVSFSGVMFSSLTSAISKSLDKDHDDKFLLVAPRPLPGHPIDRMVNHITGAAYNVPINLDMSPIKRLMECDKIFKMVNTSLFPTHVFPLLVRFLSYHIIPIAKFGFKSRYFGVCMSNNMGNRVPAFAFDNKYKLLEFSGATGTYDGVTGLVICIVSSADKIHLHGVANSDALSQQELELLIEHMIAEINILTKVELLSNRASIANSTDKAVKARKISM